LLLTHAGLLLHSLLKNSVTIDEVVHLPTGIAYWDRGEFWGYHHNPPFIRLLFALPAVVLDTPTDYSRYHYVPRSRRADDALGQDFMFLNRNHYAEIFSISRCVVAALSVLGAYFCWRWSREVFGDVGALISLALWCFCPNVLAHAGLVTPDVGSMVVGFLATYAFWKYLQSPSLGGAAVSGVLLGLTEASKFSYVALPGIWLVLVIALIVKTRRSSERLKYRTFAGHGLVVLIVSLTVLNDVYLGEGTGRNLGTFDFRSHTLTVAKNPDDDRSPRVNRFRGTVLENVPIPLPEHYVLGFDDQMHDVDSGGFYKYLRGDLRRGDGWWHYYLYCLLVKTPVGTLLLLTIAFGSFLLRSPSKGIVTDLTLLLPIVVFLFLISSQTGLNSHLRYVLPIYPFAFVYCGCLGRYITKNRLLRLLVIVAIACNIASVVRFHPHYLAYFNEAAGGPNRALDHLADSNIDWGQGLVALKEWKLEHALEQPMYLAYFGTMDPHIYGLEYLVPPKGLATSEGEVDQYDPWSYGPIPGLHAISANFLIGIPFPTWDQNSERIHVPLHSYRYFNEFEPIARPGYSIYVYEITLEEANRVRAKLELPLLSGTDSDSENE
jgi:hypothetical protein